MGYARRTGAPLLTIGDPEDPPALEPPPTRPETEGPFPPPPGVPSSFAPPPIATTQPAPDAVANAILEKLEPSFRAIHDRIAALSARIETVNTGVKMSLEGQDSLASTLGGHGQRLRTIVDGVATISARMTLLEQGVSAQVHHEVTKALDAHRTIEQLGELERAGT